MLASQNSYLSINVAKPQFRSKQQPDDIVRELRIINSYPYNAKEIKKSGTKSMTDKQFRKYPAPKPDPKKIKKAEKLYEKLQRFKKAHYEHEFAVAKRIMGELRALPK
jgi:hypothetical protein